MAQVSVKDVAEIRLFSQGVQAFHDKYNYQLFLVEQATQEDISTARKMLEVLEKKMQEAESHLQDCERDLINYKSAQRQDRDGNPIPPDPEVVRLLSNAVTQAEENLARSRRRYEEGKDEMRKACIALEMAASAASSGRSVINDYVASACRAIERAAAHIESYSI